MLVFVRLVPVNVLSSVYVPFLLVERYTSYLEAPSTLFQLILILPVDALLLALAVGCGRSQVLDTTALYALFAEEFVWIAFTL